MIDLGVLEAFTSQPRQTKISTDVLTDLTTFDVV
jgi:hypothetical protein